MQTKQSKVGKVSPAAAKTKRHSKRRRADDDDTPRAFARLMQFQAGQKRPSGLDDGAPKTKKTKREDATLPKSEKTSTVSTGEGLKEKPKILPGEKLSEFAARVDQAIPVSGLKGKNSRVKSAALGLKERKTKHERRLQRMQNDWREEDQRRKDKEADMREEMEDNEDNGVNLQWQTGKKGKKKRGDDDDEDPWAVIKAKRNDRQKHMQDVVQAPPQLKDPKERAKVYAGAKVNVADIPGAAGSLRRREELAGERQSIVEEYRRMMASRNKEQ